MSTTPNITIPGTPGPRHPAPEDLVLFAMQLFQPDESAAIAHHLESCPECRAELARIHSDLALTAATVELQSPPESARQRLLQQVAREKKIVTLPQPQAQPDPHPPIAAFGRNGSILSIDDSIDDRPAKRGIGRTILGVAGWTVAAGLAIFASLEYIDRQTLRDTVTAQSGLVQRLTAEADNAHQLMDALTDPKAVRVTLSLSAKPVPKAQPIGGVTYNPEKGALVFLASNLDPLQTYKTYELWIIPADGAAPIPAGTFHPDDQGNASVIMPDLPRGVAAKAFGVTIEAEGGSQTPTPPIVLSGS
jgi:Anti-sigma-K factor rskA